MGQQFTVADRDVVKDAIVQSTHALAGVGSGIAEAAGSISITVGTNIFNGTNRFEVDRALQQIRDVQRERFWPEGPLATSFAYLAAVPAVKSQVLVGNIAALADDFASEDAIVLTYNQFTGTGQGSSGNYGSAIDKIRDHIREILSDG